jgi:hypothetical protein
LAVALLLLPVYGIPEKSNFRKERGTMERKSFLKQFRFILPIGLAILLISSPTGAQNLYSVDLVDPNYIEVADDHVLPLQLDGDDECVEVSLPFKFTFYKVAYTRAYVSTNGYLNFLAANSDYYNVSIPTTAIPNAAIYALWDDLVVNPAKASLRAELLGAAPNRQFVIEWRNVAFRDAPSLPPIDFEIVLHENGVILLQYRKIDNDRKRGKYATVGIEDETGISGVLFLCNQASIEEGENGEYAIRFAPSTSTKSVPVDIKPRACPNHLDVDSHGVLHAAILGTSDLDVKTIDPKTVTLGGVAVLSKQEDPLKMKTKKKVKLVASKLRHQGWILEDVGTPCEPYEGKTDPKQCNHLGRDGYLDIVLKFDTQAIADSLGDDVKDKEPITLQLRGQLLDGTEISGEDVVIIMKKGKGHAWGRGHDWHDRGHHRGHDKDRGHGHDKGHGHD